MLAMTMRSFDEAVGAGGAGLAGAPANPSSAYGGTRPNLPAIAMIVAVHAGLLTALVKLDVVRFKVERPRPTVVQLIPEPVAPPPEPQPSPERRRHRPSTPVVVTPQPLVAVQAPPLPTLAVAIDPPPAVAAAAEPVLAAANVDPGPPAPVTPPDGMAATLGNPSPRYPIECRRRRQEGTVRLRVVITEAGQVKEIRVHRSSGVEALDEAALKAVGRWRFRPGLQAGRPVEAVGFLNIPFRLA